MPMFKCGMCGRVWDVPEIAVTAECPQCGTVQAVVRAAGETPEEKTAAASRPKTLRILATAGVVIFAAAALAWYEIQVVPPEPEEAAVSAVNLHRETVDAQRRAKGAREDARGGKSLRESYEELANGGDPWAQYSLGEMYFTGQGAEKDLAAAAQWFRKAAEQGHAEAQYRMGSAYYNGVKRNYREAVRWYQMAATHESTDAQTALGNMYHNGTGVVKSYFNAVWWYSQAAEKGNVWAQYYLGNMYRKGLGVAQDMEKARELYQKASEQGHLGAMRALEHIK